MTNTVSLKDHRDWRPDTLPEHVVYTGRPCYRGGWRLPAHPLGSPYTVKQYGTYESLRLYIEWIQADPERIALAKTLQGKSLACHCKAGEPCHAQIIAAIADGQPERIPHILEAARNQP